MPDKTLNKFQLVRPLGEFFRFLTLTSTERPIFPQPAKSLESLLSQWLDRLARINAAGPNSSRAFSSAARSDIPLCSQIALSPNPKHGRYSSPFGLLNYELKQLSIFFAYKGYLDWYRFFSNSAPRCFAYRTGGIELKWRGCAE